MTADELAAFYRGAGAGTVLIGVGRLPGTAGLTTALIRSLDTDGNGKVGEEEWKAAAGTLKKLDTNDDELIGPGNWCRNSYPGAAGTLLLTPPRPALHRRTCSRRCRSFSFPRTPRRRVGPSKSLVDMPRFQAGGLAEWRERGPDASWVVRLGDQPSAERFAFAGDGVRVSGWAASGKMKDSLSSARRAMTGRFEVPLAGPEGGGNRRRGGDLSWLTPIADRDADGKLDRTELDAWLDLQSQIARGLVLVTVLDGAGLFEILDTSHDGALSVRELRAAWERLKEAGCVTGDTFDRARLPRVLLAAVSWGYPRDLAIVLPSGPAWSRAMDRNGDGDVSRREFTGPAAEFDKLDRDRDGLIDADEAARAVASSEAFDTPPGR